MLFNAIDIGSTQQLNHRVALHKSNIKIPQTRKLCVSKHIYECSNGHFHIMPLYQSDNYSRLTEIIEKHFVDKFKPSFNRT